MGLDQYAHLRDQKDMSFNAYDDNYTQKLMGLLEKVCKITEIYVCKI